MKGTHKVRIQNKRIQYEFEWSDPFCFLMRETKRLADVMLESVISFAQVV